MLRTRSTPSRVVGWILLVALTAPSAFAQAPKPAAAPAPSAAPAPAAAPSAAPSTPAPAPSTPPAAPAAPLPPFTKSLANSLTGLAKAEYEAGKVLYTDGDYAGASLKFQRAYDESKDPRLLWNTAAAEKNLRHYAKVVELIQRYETEAGTRLKADERAEAQALLTTVKAFTCDVSLDVTPEGAAVFVDDVQVGVSPLTAPVLLDMGEHRIKVSKEGYQDFTTSQSLQGGAPFSLMVALQQAVHEGKLHVVASPGESISIDGKVVGSGEWEGVLPSGIHSVAVTATGKRPYQSDVAVQDGQSQSVRVTLDVAGPAAGEKKNLTWVWVAGGAVLAAGLGVGAYFVLKPEDKPQVQGTLQTIELPLLRRF